MRELVLSILPLAIFLSVCLQSCVKEDSRQRELPDIRTMLEGEYAEGRMLVRFKECPAGEMEISAVSEKFEEWGVRVRHRYHGELDGLYSVEGDFRVRDFLPVVLSDPAVEYAEPDYKIEMAYQPNDPGAQWGAAEGYHLSKIEAFDAWDTTRGDPSFVIAFVDSGCMITHEDIAGNLWVNAAEAGGAPGVDDDGNGYVDDIHGYDFISDTGALQDWDSHGTTTTSAAVSVGDNGKGTAGVAYQCKAAVLRGNRYIETAVEAFQYAVAKGFRVVNASWGSSGSQALSDAITELDNNGILLVCVAGNQGRDLATFSIYPACYPHKNTIVVMNTNMYDFKRDSSNWGLEEADLAAPGTELYLAQNWGGYGYFTGTSYSTPVVSGACALLWSRYPDLTHMQVKQLILENVDVLSSLTGMCVTSGRLNIRKALEAAQGSVPGLDAEFAADKTKGAEPLCVQFTDCSTGSPESWSWSFGDGGTSAEQDPQHTYDDAGTYTVALTVSRGPESDTETKTGYIEVLAPGSLIAGFSAVPIGGSAPLTVDFIDESAGGCSSWIWNFGDGGTGTQQSPMHTYNSPGTYTVSLTVSDGSGSDTAIKDSYIIVTGDPVPALQEEKRRGCSCAVRRGFESDNPVDVIGYFVPALLLAGFFAAMKFHKRKGACG